MPEEGDTPKDDHLEQAKVAKLIELMNALEHEQLVGRYAFNREFHDTGPLLQYLQSSEFADAATSSGSPMRLTFASRTNSLSALASSTPFSRATVSSLA
jgi:hypothetical protein